MGLFYNYEHYKILDEGVPDENIYTHFGKHKPFWKVCRQDFD